jgi:DNA/RNA endonuclease YhcR with UshA esterase domain
MMTSVNSDTEYQAATGAHCHSCGRFVGPYETCPYCGAQMEGRISVRWVKGAAVLLATVGLLGLWLLARTTEIPHVTAAEAQGTMNMAYVKVAGRITGNLTYDPESQYLGFWVTDESGEVRVSAYRDVTEALLAARKIPAPGDAITVAGTLRIREDFVSLTLNVPEHVDLRRPDPVALNIGEITLLDEGLRVRVDGQVQDVYSPFDGLTIINVRDGTGEIAVAVDEIITTTTGALPEITPGQGIEVVGTVSLYRDSPQLIPADVADITLGPLMAEPVVEGETEPSEPAMETMETRPLGKLSEADEGARVQIAGRVVAMGGFSGGMKAVVDDGTAQILLLLWDSVYSELPDPTALDIGAEIIASGEIHLYEGELELVPDRAADVEIVQAAPEIPWVSIDELTESDVGRVVRLRGVLGEPEGFSAGVKVPLDDGTGAITVLLWSNIAVEVTPAPAAGLPVEVIGTVESYEGELELIPRSPIDWRTGKEAAP